MVGWLDELLDAVGKATGSENADRTAGWWTDEGRRQKAEREAEATANEHRAAQGGAKVAEWIDRERQSERQVKTRTGGMMPPGLEAAGINPADWADMKPSDKEQLLNLLNKAGADPFGDKEFLDSGGLQRDQYLLDIGVGEEPSTYQWRKKLLREDADSGFEKGNRGFSPQARGRFKPKVAKGMITGQKYMARINTLNKDELIGLQRDLYAAGFMGGIEGQRDKEPIWGAPDVVTKQAAALLIATTLTFGGQKSITEVIDLFKQQNDPDGDGKPGTNKRDIQLPTIHLTNPLDLQVAAQNVGVDLMGRRLDDATARGITSGYTGLEMAAGRANQAAAASENGGGSVTEAPAAGAYVEDQIRKTHAAEVDSYTYLQNFNTLLRAVGLD